MKITPSIPFHVARAYGTRPTAAPTSTPALKPTAPVAPTRSATTPPEGVQQLIAGRVARPVDFDDVSTPAAPAGAPQAYQLYNRAADKLEAAVRVGTTLDLQG